MRKNAIAHTSSQSTSGKLIITILSAFMLLTSCQNAAQNTAQNNNGQNPSEAPLTESGKILSAPNGSTKTEPNPTSSAVTNTRAKKITFRHPDGTPEFSLQFKSTGGKLLDGSGAVITNLILQEDGAIKLTDANYNIVGYIARTQDTQNSNLQNNSIQIEGPKRTKTLFSFSTAADGSALLTRHNGSTVYRLDTTESGYIVASEKAPLYAVQTQKGKGQMQTTEGQVVIASDSAISASALAIFGFDKLTQAQQAGLAYALSLQES